MPSKRNADLPKSSKKTVDHVYHKLLQVLDLNFSKPIGIEALVISIDHKNSKLIVGSLNGNKKLECITQHNIDNIREGDTVRLKGFIKLVKNEPGKFYLQTDYLYKTDEENKYDETRIHEKLQNTLNSESVKPHIEKHHKKTIPKFAMNIGLIAVTDGLSVDNFKISFQEKCTGELFVYYLKKQDIETDIITALQYFQKYHQIDIICILSDRISLNQLLAMSSKKTLKYLINRKKFPYIMSIVNTEMTIPLSAVLSNRIFTKISDAVDFIQRIQISFRKQLSTSLEITNTMIDRLIENKKENIMMAEQDLQELNIYKGQPGNKSENFFEKAQKLLVQRMDKEIHFLTNFENYLMKKVIDNNITKDLLQKASESNSRVINEKKTTEQPAGIVQKIENIKSDKDLVDRLNINIIRSNGEF